MIARKILVLSVAIVLCCGVFGGDVPAYAGASGGILLPGNGNSLDRAAEVAVRAGIYSDDFLAWEIEGVSAPNVGGGALNGVAVRGLFHLAGWEAFDKLFGCERFDPFITFGGAVRFGGGHVFAEDSHRTATGPAIGIGAFYHLTENFDLRCDAQAHAGIDSPCGMLYSVVAGVQWNFGGGGE